MPSGPVIWSRASSRDLLGANRRVSCRLRRDSRSSRESGVSTLDAFVLRRGKGPARIEYASSTLHPRLPLPSLRQLLVQIFSLPPISFSFMTVCPYDSFSGWRKSARRALIGRGIEFHRPRDGETKSPRVGRFPPSLPLHQLWHTAGGRAWKGCLRDGMGRGVPRRAGHRVAVGRPVA